MTRPSRRAAVIALSLLGVTWALAASRSEAVTAAKTSRGAAQETPDQLLSRIPLAFEENRGQTDNRVRFLARAAGQHVFLSANEIVMDVRSRTAAGQPRRGVVRMGFAGSARNPRISAEGAPVSRVNYLKGRDSARWQRRVPTYSAVRYEGLYPGIDARVYGTGRHVEYDLLVSPGANPAQARLSFRDVGGRPAAIRLDRGDIVVPTPAGDVRHAAPKVYQERNGRRETVAASYRIDAGGLVGFALGRYDRSRPLVIDPVLTYTTYIGGLLEDEAIGVSSDAFGNCYLTGWTNSIDFPVTLGVFQPSLREDFDAFVTCIDPGNCSIIYSTYLGGGLDADGPGVDRGNAIKVDLTGSAFVTGYTDSPDFPTTLGCAQPSAGGNGDGFVTKLSPDGSSLLYSTYLGGSAGLPNTGRLDFPPGNGPLPGSPGIFNEEGRGIDLDADGNAYVAGITDSDDFPSTPGAFQPLFGGGNSDGFVTKVNAAGTGFTYSSFLGGGPTFKSEGNDFANDIALDALDNAYVTGATDALNFPLNRPLQVAVEKSDAFAVKVNPAGSALVYSTFLGGLNNDQGNAIDVDVLGRAYVGGATNSRNFPSAPVPVNGFKGGDCDGFLLRLSTNATSMEFLSFIGGPQTDFVTGVAVNDKNRAWVCGGAKFDNRGPRVSRLDGGDAFVQQFNSAGTAVLFKHALGGRKDDAANHLALDDYGNVYVVGGTESKDFTVGRQEPFQRNLAGGMDGFIAKYGDRQPRDASVTISPRHLRLESRDGERPIGKIKICNTGRQPIAFRIVDVQGPFENVSGFVQAVLAPGQCRFIYIQFDPTRGTRGRGVVIIATTLPGTYACTKVTLFGKVKDPGDI